METSEKEKLERRKVRLTMRAIAHEIVAELIHSNLNGEGGAHDAEIEKELERIEARMRERAVKLEHSANNPPPPKEKKPTQSRKGRHVEIKADTTDVNWEVTKTKRGKR